MSFNCKFQLTYLEWYRIHYKIFCSWAKYNLIYESLVGVWITHCDFERLGFLNKNLLIRISLLIIRLLLLLLLLLGLLYELGYLLLLLFFKLLLLPFQLTLLLVEYFLLLLKLSHFDPMTIFLGILTIVSFFFIILVFFWWHLLFFLHCPSSLDVSVIATHCWLWAFLEIFSTRLNYLGFILIMTFLYF